MKKLLTIAGSDSIGGAGIQGDIKTFSAFRCYSMSVITAVTAQNTRGVLDVQNISPTMIQKQIEAIFADVPPDGIKIGCYLSLKQSTPLQMDSKSIRCPQQFSTRSWYPKAAFHFCNQTQLNY